MLSACTCTRHNANITWNAEVKCRMRFPDRHSVLPQLHVIVTEKLSTENANNAGLYRAGGYMYMWMKTRHVCKSAPVQTEPSKQVPNAGMHRQGKTQQALRQGTATGSFSKEIFECFSGMQCKIELIIDMQCAHTYTCT
jgi:hypothetical protein